MRAAHQLLCVAVFLASALPASGEGLDPAVQAKISKKLEDVRAMAADPKVVAAVKKHNAAPSDEAKAMTQEKWKALSMLDPIVRGLARNEAASALQSRRSEAISEAFVSGADGAKVALLSKTSGWSHKGKPKHDVPMSGKEWQGAVEVDESTGQQQVQIAVPVLDGQKAIGSLVVGLSIAKLR